MGSQIFYGPANSALFRTTSSFTVAEKRMIEQSYMAFLKDRIVSALEAASKEVEEVENPTSLRGDVNDPTAAWDWEDLQIETLPLGQLSEGGRIRRLHRLSDRLIL